MEDAGFGLIIEICPQLLHAPEVGVQPAATNLVSSRFGDIGMAKTGQQRSYQHDRTPEFTGLPVKGFGREDIKVDVVSLKSIGVG